MNIFKRLIGSLLDKIILIVLFCILFFVFCSKNLNDLGYFIGTVLNNSYCSERQYRYIVYLFTIFNMLYYFICEANLKASLGKYIMGGRCVDLFDNVIDRNTAFNRAIALGLFVFLVLQVKSVISIMTYYDTIIFFFFVIDVSVIFRNRSLIDIVTKTYYKSANEINKEIVNKNNLEDADHAQSMGCSSFESVNNSKETDDNSCETKDTIITNDVVDNDSLQDNNPLSDEEKENSLSDEKNNKTMDNIKSTDEPVKEKKGLKNYIFLLFVISLFICICISSYYAINKVFYLNGLQVLKEYNEKYYTYFDKEKIVVQKNSKFFSKPTQIGSETIENMKNLGPIPDGKPISMFSGDDAADENSSCHYDYYLTTLKLDNLDSNSISIAKYKKLINSFQKKLSDYTNKKVPLTDKFIAINMLPKPIYGNCVTYSALYRNVQSDSLMKVVRSVFFANQRAYILDLWWNPNNDSNYIKNFDIGGIHITKCDPDYDPDNIRDKILANFAPIDVPNYNKSVELLKDKVMVAGMATFVSLMILFIYFCYTKRQVLNGRSTIKTSKFYMFMLSVYIALAAFMVVNTYNAYKTYYDEFYVFHYDGSENERSSIDSEPIKLDCNLLIDPCHKDMGIYLIAVPVLLVFCIIISGSVSRKIWKSNNKTAIYLSLFIFCMIVVNTTLFYVKFNEVINEYIHEDIGIYDLGQRHVKVKYICYTLMINCILFPCAVGLSRIKQLRDFSEIKWIDKYFRYRNVSYTEQKALLAIVIYPLFTICMLPYSGVVLLFVIPILLLFIAIVEIKAVIRWIIKDKEGQYQMKSKQSNAIFKDYYLILDIKSDAADDCVDRAFNKAMAKYNANRGSKMFSKQYVYDLQEAYRVLSSTERLKPEYDEEYQLYLKADKQVYEYTNINTCRDIKTIQDEIHHNNVKSNKVIDYLLKKNAMVLSIFIFLMGLLATYVFIKVEEYQSDSSYQTPTNVKYDEFGNPYIFEEDPSQI